MTRAGVHSFIFATIAAFFLPMLSSCASAQTPTPKPAADSPPANPIAAAAQPPAPPSPLKKFSEVIKDAKALPGYFTLYAHAAEIRARSGDSVSRGQVIGKVGDTGSLEGPQLYFELRHKGKPQDPLAWLQPR